MCKTKRIESNVPDAEEIHDTDKGFWDYYFSLADAYYGDGSYCSHPFAFDGICEACGRCVYFRREYSSA
jgi:hypothetical protein